MIIATDGSEKEVTNEHLFNLLELVEHTTLNPYQKTWMTLRINACDSVEEYEAIRRNLLLNRIESKDRIAFGLNFNMTDISNTIRNMNREARKIKLIKIEND